ncbi:uncharacterized protein LOC130451974 [Diorhabda sublineata]|uniref:uncharacterized protein LOC130451974 n=1 Tax=Diorhabda sublineata TaxID=1163346 RepID=UPI0024E1524E|nr:uncharacterized protein LOC130451974 [Diorhabda sublineata]
MAKFVQINLGRRRPAHDLLKQTIIVNNIDISIVSEPNKILIKDSKWYVDENFDAAIGITNNDIRVLNSGRGNGFVWIEYTELVVFSCYISLNLTLEVFGIILNQLKDAIGTRNKKCLIAGDFNAKAAIWGSIENDKRGDMLSEWAADLDLVSLNHGNTPTFSRGNSSSHIDVTFVSNDINKMFGSWQVLDQETLSDHNYIFFEIPSLETQKVAPEKIIKGWKIEEKKIQYFISEIKQKIREETDTLNPQGLMAAIKKACQRTFQPTYNYSGKRKPVYWWSSQISEARKECLCKKRYMTCANRISGSTVEEREKARAEYKEKRNYLKKMIKDAKKHSWKTVIEEVQNDVWGKGYQIVTKRFLLRPKTEISQDIIPKEASGLFPKYEITTWPHIDMVRTDIIPWTQEELVTAANKIKPKKAAGPDKLSPVCSV